MKWSSYSSVLKQKLMLSLVQDERINLIVMFANVQVACMHMQSHRNSTYMYPSNYQPSDQTG